MPTETAPRQAGYGSYIDGQVAQGYTHDQAVQLAAWKQAVDQLHDLSVTLANAIATKNTAAQAELETQIAYWKGQTQQLAAETKTAGQPSAFLQALAGFSDQVQRFGGAAAQGVGGLLAEVEGLLKNLPILIPIILGLLLLGVLARRGWLTVPGA